MRTRRRGLRHRSRRAHPLIYLLMGAALGLLIWWLGGRLGEVPVVSGSGGGPYDLILKGGTVYDGTGGPGRRADVAIRGERIAAVGDLSGAEAAQVIDVTGLAVAPGFIDPHNHTWDILPEYPTDPDAKSMVMQGVTTVAGGVDGRSFWPIADGLARIEATGTGVNYATFVGQGTVWNLVMGGSTRRRPTPAELDRMRALVRQGMEAGALGLSTGLEYDGKAATTEEITALAEVAAAYGGLYSTHVRQERDNLLGGVAEALRIGREAGIPVKLSHLKLMGPAQWRQIDDLLGMIQEARRQGQEVTADVYPYLAPDYLMNRPLAEVSGAYPPEAIFIRYARDGRLVGRSLADLAAAAGHPVAEVAAGLVEADPGIRTAVEVRRKDLMIRLIQAEFAMAGTDGEAQPFYRDPDRVARLVHPRSYGSYPLYLRLVREQGIMALPEMIRKMTGAPADVLGLKDRGYTRAGYFADLVVFDPDRVAERATWWEPQAYPVGIAHVFVNGRAAVLDGKHQPGARYGKVLRREHQ